MCLSKKELSLILLSMRTKIISVNHFRTTKRHSNFKRFSEEMHQIP